MMKPFIYNIWLNLNKSFLRIENQVQIIDAMRFILILFILII